MTKKRRNQETLLGSIKKVNCRKCYIILSSKDGRNETRAPIHLTRRWPRLPRVGDSVTYRFRYLDGKREISSIWLQEKELQMIA